MIGIFLLSLLVGGRGRWASSLVGTQETIQITIPSGMGTVKSGEYLQEKSVIRSGWVWVAFIARHDSTHLSSRTVTEHERVKQQIQCQRQAEPKP